jgi:hypothetical protein
MAKDKKSDFVTRRELDTALETFAEKLRKEFRELLSGMPVTARDSDGYPLLPPTPPMVGKGYVGERVKIAGTIDRALMDRINAEIKKRGIRLARLLDTMAWHYFDRPPLSFQDEDD